MKDMYSFTAWVNRLTGITAVSEAVTRRNGSGRIRRRILASVITIVIVSYSAVSGQTIVWGGSTGTGLDWTLGANWSGGVAPADGADVVFDTPGTIEFSTLPASTSLNSLTVLQGTVTLTGSTSSLFILGGNAGTDLTVASVAALNTGSLVTLRLQDGATADISGALTNGGVYDCGTGSSVTTVNDTFTNTGTISNTAKTKMFFTATGKYIHFQPGGTIPVATWDVASTCTVTTTAGSTGSVTKAFTIPSATMPLGSFVWDSPNQGGPIDLGGEVTEIAGDFTVISTGGSLSNIQLGRYNTGTMTVNGNYLQMAGKVCIGPKESTNSMTLAVDGNFILSGGYFYVNTASGTGILNVGGNFSSGGWFYYTSDPNPAIGTVNIEGNFTITAGSFNLSQTVSTGTLNIGGNVSLAGSGVTETGAGSGDVYLNGTGVQSWSPGGFVNNNVNVTVSSGSYLQMAAATSYISGAGVFTLSPGATLGIKATDGITAETATATGQIRCTGGRVFSSGANYIYNGTAAQLSGTGLAQNTPANLTISNSAGVSLSGVTTISGLLTMTSGTLNLANNNLTVGSLTGSTNITNGSATSVVLTAGSDGTTPAPYNGVISNGTGTTVSFVKTGAGTMTLGGTNTFTGTTTITGGVLQLGSATTLSNSSNVVLNGGTLSTGATAGYGETAGTLALDATSVIALGTGVHSLTFSNSSAVAWNSAATLTVTGWTGKAETSGTAGKIFAGSSATGLTAAQLSQINFTGYGSGSKILATGEVVPVSAAVVTLASSDPAVPAATIAQNSANNVIYAFSLSAASDDVTMTGLQITMDGLFSDMDITNIKAWYSADGSFSATGDVLLSTTTGVPGPGSYAFTDWSNQLITSGSTAYIFITADIPCNAMVGSTMMVTAVTTGDITLNMGTLTGSASAGGEQSIGDGMPANVVSPAATPGDGITELSWTNPSCYDLVMIVAKEGSAVAETPTGDGSSYMFDQNFGTPGTEFESGYVVYIGDLAPVTVTGLTNGSTYYFTLFTKRGLNWSTGVTVSANPVSKTTFLYRSAQSGAWESATTWQVSTDGGQSWVTAASTPDNTNGPITIQNGHTVTVNSEINIDQMTVVAGGQLTVAGGVFWVVGSAQNASYINGILENRATVIASGGELVFNSGSLYRHNRIGGGVPVATWNTASTCEIKDIAGTSLALADAQSFGNFIWDCANQTAATDLGGKLNSVKGNLEVRNTKGFNLSLGLGGGGDLAVGGNVIISAGTRFLINQSSSTRAMNIAGNFTNTGGTVYLTNTGGNGTMDVAGNLANSSGTIYLTNGGSGTINVSGDFSSGGYFYFSSGSPATAVLNIEGNATISGGTFNLSGTSSTGKMTLAGNLTQTGGTITESSTGRGLITFDGTGVQTYTTGGTVSNFIDYLIPAGGAVTLNGTLTTGGTVTVNSTVASSGSLIVNGAVTNGVTYNRQLNTANYGGDRHYLSSPVGSNSNTNASKVATVWGYQETDNSWPVVTMTSLVSGKGYNIDNIDGTDGLISFTGTALNSNVLLTLTSPYRDPYISGDYSLRTLADGRDNDLNWGGGGWNLVGNPYTSALDAMAVISANASSIDQTCQAFYVYDAAGAGSYKIIAAVTPGYIQAGQGFWVMANNNNVTFTFSPSQRIHSTGLTMLKSAVSSPSEWPGLNLKAKVGSVERGTRVFYNDDMKAGLDPGYDVGLLSSGAAVEVYTLLAEDNGVNFAYQSLPVTGCGSFIIPVGVDCKDGGEVTFSADIIPLGDYVFYLEDRVAGKFTDLSLDSYKVTLPANSYGTGRFFIYASNSGMPTGIDDPASVKNLHIWYYDRNIIVKGEVSSKAVCEIYDTQGRVIYKKLLEDQQLNTIPVTVVPRGVYIVVVRDGSRVYTQKVAVL